MIEAIHDGRLAANQLVATEVRAPWTPEHERELARASKAAERYIRRHGVGNKPGHGLVLTMQQQRAPEWIAIRDQLTAALWPRRQPEHIRAAAAGEQLALFPGATQ